MARGTDFCGVHSFRDLHLIEAKVDIEPAKPKTNFIDIPGADGSKDFSESPAGRVVFKTRKVTWTYKLYPGDNWLDKYTEVSNAINGKSGNIRLHGDLYVFKGRISVDKYASDSILHTITVVAICQPYKQRVGVTITADLTTEYSTFTLQSLRMPAVPTIKVTAGTTLLWAGNTFSLSPGTHKVLDIELSEGENILQAKTTTGTGSIQIWYPRGVL